MASQSLRKSSKVLKFDQPGEFYSRIARKSMERNDLTEAMSLYRIALNRDPRNIDYRVSLAGIFTEMGQYESSNRILIRLARENQDTCGCYFSIGCNFLGLQEYDSAQESFRRYIRMEPDGEYVDEAEELLLMIHEDIEALSYPDTKLQKAQEIAEKGKNELDVGNYRKAVQQLKRAISLDGEMVHARNNLALAYFLNEQPDKAKDTARAVLEKHPDNIHALCNLAIFCDVKSGDPEAVQCFEKVRDAETDMPDEVYKIALTMCEAGDDEAALYRFETALEYRPYDMRTLFCAGAACYNMGDYRNAKYYFERMNRSDPDDSIGSYYRGVAQQALDGDKKLDRIGYHCQVPLDEVVRRIRYLNDCTGNSRHQLRDIWIRDSQFRAYVLWGLKIQDPAIKKAMLELLCLINDANAEEVLRDFIMQKDEPDTLKNEAFALLKRMRAEEPFIAYMKDGLVEARVTVFDTPNEDSVPETYTMALELCISRMRNRGLDNGDNACVDVWKSFVEIVENYPRLHSREAWAAALEYATLQYIGQKPTPVAELADVYDADEHDIILCITELQAVLDLDM